GLTQTQLEEALAKKFRSEYLKNPKVTVTITTLRPFYIVGEGEKPGEYPYKSGLNVLTAMATAGGPTYRASRTSVQIQRRGETSMREYPISVTVPVLPGDVIRVPERYFYSSPRQQLTLLSFGDENPRPVRGRSTLPKSFYACPI